MREKSPGQVHIITTRIVFKLKFTVYFNLECSLFFSLNQEFIHFLTLSHSLIFFDNNDSERRKQKLIYLICHSLKSWVIWFTIWTKVRSAQPFLCAHLVQVFGIVFVIVVVVVVVVVLTRILGLSWGISYTKHETSRILNSTFTCRPRRLKN